MTSYENILWETVEYHTMIYVFQENMVFLYAMVYTFKNTTICRGFPMVDFHKGRDKLDIANAS